MAEFDGIMYSLSVRLSWQILKNLNRLEWEKYYIRALAIGRKAAVSVPENSSFINSIHCGLQQNFRESDHHGDSFNPPEADEGLFPGPWGDQKHFD
jgi:hypothetical protein